ncbi:MAG: carboxymethylenebutenolidase [Gammaproteobacteria bacterium]|jgi:carboxymethylenebutenolidase
MQERHENLQTPEGTMPTFVVHPDGDGPFPVVLFYMDAPAIREELYDMARRIAAQGYYVLLPDLFYRFGVIRFPVRTPKSSFVWRECMAHMSNANVMDDTQAMIELVDSDAKARAGALGCIGFCMSGRLVTSAAGTFPDRVAVICSMYGVGIVTAHEDSPHYLVKNTKAECYYSFAQTDATVPSFVVPTLKAELEAHGIEHRLDIWPGTHHGFSFASRDIYDHNASEKSWEIFFDMCERRVKNA